MFLIFQLCDLEQQPVNIHGINTISNYAVAQTVESHDEQPMLKGVQFENILCFQ